MADQLKQVLRGRFFVLFIFSGLFAILAFGQMGLFKTGEIPYPSQNVLEVNQFSSSNEEFFTDLEDFAHSHDLILYRSVYFEGKIKGFVFGEASLTAKLTKDPKLLETITPVGMYFVDGNLTKAALSDLKKLNIKAERFPTGWNYIASELLFGFSIRTTTFWISLLLYAMGLLAFKIAALKKVLIARTLGYNKLGILREMLAMVIGLASFALLIMFSNHYFGSMLFNSYVLIIGVIYVMLTLLMLLVNLIFAIYVKTIPIIAILKNKQRGTVFSYIWLLVIMISITLMALSLTSYYKGYEASKIRKASFAKWEKIDKLAQLTVTDPSFEQEQFSENSMNVSMTKKETEKLAKEEATYYEKWRKFDHDFTASEKLFVESPRELDFLNATSDDGKTTEAQDFYHPEETIHIENKWIARTWQVSPSLVKLSTR